MRRDVGRLRALKAAALEDCVEAAVTDGRAVADPRARAWSRQVASFRLRPDRAENRTCQALTFSENGFISVLRRRQWPRLTSGTS